MRKKRKLKKIVKVILSLLFVLIVILILFLCCYRPKKEEKPIDKVNYVSLIMKLENNSLSRRDEF